MADFLAEDPTTEEDSQKGKYLTFSLGEEEYGLEIKHVTEIVGIQTITAVPDLPTFIKGIINLRGQIIPVMDVRLRFKKTPRDYDDRTCVVVVTINNMAIGLIVDTVSEVLPIPDENIALPPQLKAGGRSGYIKGIGKIDNAVKLILDCDKLLNDEEVAEMLSAG